MKHPLDNLKVAIVYDHLTTQYGGAELVLQVLLQLFPEAPLFTTVFDDSKITWISKQRVKTSFLQNFGWLKKQHQLLAPLHPLAIEQLDLSAFDLIISVTAGVAKGVQTLPHQLHVCYQLTPPRYLQSEDEEQQEYVRSQQLLNLPLMRSITTPLFGYINNWDQVAAWRPDNVIAISQLVADRIEKRYNRKVDEIIYPPFIPFASADASPAINAPEFLLSFSRLVSYKHIDLAIKSCIALNKMLVVAGEGILKDSLIELSSDHVYQRKKSQSISASVEAAAKKNKLIVFVGNCSDEEKRYLFMSCKAFLMPGVEDFGLTALEAAHAGVVPIINAHSGVAEVLTNQKYAIHVQDQTVAALKEAILKLEHTHISETALTATASKYDQEHFSEAFMNTLYQFWLQHSTISPVKLQK